MMRIGTKSKLSLRRQEGLTLIELMFAMVVLAVGLGGIMTMVIAALASNGRNRTDTSATWLSVMILQQMAEIPAGTNTIFTITDCSGTVWNVNTAPGGATLRGTDNVPMWVSNDINFNVAYGAAAPGNGYQMSYASCGTNGQAGIVYDVRWNVTAQTMKTKTVTVGAKIVGAAATNAGGASQNLYYSMPVQMKSIIGN
jgi:prepilin-type N-terminal cleavage/methylation domain-containing protein